VAHAPVTIGRHVIIGAGSIVLPGATLEEGVAIGSLSLIKGLCREFGVYFGVPVKRIAERKRNLLLLEEKLLASIEGKGTPP
jgi:galactoside O-acetyltransferase